MRRESFAKGVMAAARVACAAALVGAAAGCRTDPQTYAAAADSDTACEEPITIGDPLQECREQVAETFSDPEPTPSDSDLSCCQEIAEYYDSVGLEGLGGWVEYSACCSALNWNGDTMACTPWGPPCPPAMRAS